MGLTKITKYTERVFECKRGDLTIRGTEYRPQGESLPAIIVSHGFMANQDSVREYAKAMAEDGFCAYCFDFCGGSAMKNQSDGESTQMSVLTEVKDLEAVLAYVESLPYIQDGVVLMGCSQGGFVSALTAVKHPEEVKKLILFYPALCIPDDARKGNMRLAVFDPENIPEIFPCGPMMLGKCYVEDVIRMDVNEEIKGYTGPVLIVHGDQDDIVDLSYSVEAQKAYENAELKVIKGAGHGFHNGQDQTAIGYIRAFI